MDIELREVSALNWKQVAALSVLPGQRAFVASNAYSLAQAAYEADVYPLAVYRGGELVGFVMYAFDGECDSWAMYRLMVDSRYQRQGIGEAVVRKLLEVVARERGHVAFYTSAEPENDVAIRLYEKIGFVKTGRLVDGEVDMAIQLQGFGEVDMAIQLQGFGELDMAIQLQEGVIAVVVREFGIADYAAVMRLLNDTPGMGLNDIDDSREGIERYLARNPGMSFVAEAGGEVVGFIMSGHDGRRGFIYHACVREGFRRGGVGRRLAEGALGVLRAAGISKVALVAFRGNDCGNGFWEALGFIRRDDLVYHNIALADIRRIDT